MPSNDLAAGLEPGSIDARRWTRDMSVLLALPAMWVDHEPEQIASGLLSVLSGMLELDGAYLRFDDGQGDGPLERWEPASAAALGGQEEARAEGGAARLPLALPWGSGIVAITAPRSDFPTAVELHLLRVATGQAAIAIHTARRLQREQAARVAAESALARQDALLRSLLDDVEPALTDIAARIRQAATTIDDPPGAVPAEAGRGWAAAPDELTPLSRREAEVLGLLAQGLSNKEIAGMLWLSDRTVERHITSLYRKIGVARRSEATAFALRHGVV